VSLFLGLNQGPFQGFRDGRAKFDPAWSPDMHRLGRADRMVHREKGRRRADLLGVPTMPWKSMHSSPASGISQPAHIRPHLQRLCPIDLGPARDPIRIGTASPAISRVGGLPYKASRSAAVGMPPQAPDRADRDAAGLSAGWPKGMRLVLKCAPHQGLPDTLAATFMEDREPIQQSQGINLFMKCWGSAQAPGEQAPLAGLGALRGRRPCR
jgi:hypothetical protein